jgi:DNA-binding transcriptional regulator/RsmH inhibitor MraZ
VGQVNKFELWDEETWKAKCGDWMEDVSLDDLDQQSDLEDLSI